MPCRGLNDVITRTNGEHCVFNIMFFAEKSGKFMESLRFITYWNILQVPHVAKVFFAKLTALGRPS